MLNEEKRTIELNRKSVCNVLMAITSVKIDFMNEIESEDTTEDRRKIAKSSLEMWEKLHKEIKAQLDAQDGE